MRQTKQVRQKGQAVIQTIGLLFVMLMSGAFAIDTGFYFAVQQGMRNAADAAALAAVQELFKNTAGTAEDKMAAAVAEAQALAGSNMSNDLDATDVEFGYVDPISGTYDKDTFLTPTNNAAFSDTGGYNAVRVTVRAENGGANTPIPALLSASLGFNDFDAQAQAVAIYGGGVQSASGLRPIYMCQEAYDYASQNYSDVTVPLVRFYGGTLNVGGTSLNAADSCGAMGPGNWGLADLDNGSGAPGASTVGSWFENGYNGPVNVGEWYDAQPGNSIHSYSSEINTLITNQTVITIPLYEETTGTGSNVKYKVSSIAAFQVTGLKSTGSQSSRYIEGYFKKKICTGSSCTLGGEVQGGSITKLRMVH